MSMAIRSSVEVKTLEVSGHGASLAYQAVRKSVARLDLLQRVTNHRVSSPAKKTEKKGRKTTVSL